MGIEIAWRDQLEVAFRCNSCMLNSMPYNIQFGFNVVPHGGRRNPRDFTQSGHSDQERGKFIRHGNRTGKAIGILVKFHHTAIIYGVEGFGDLRFYLISFYEDIYKACSPYTASLNTSVSHLALFYIIFNVVHNYRSLTPLKDGYNEWELNTMFHSLCVKPIMFYSFFCVCNHHLCE